MTITLDDISLALNKQTNTKLRLDILDTSYTKIAELSGYATSLTWSITASSDIRRIANLTMVVYDKDYLAQSHSFVWLNRIIQVNVGSVDAYGVTHWYLIGSFLIADNTVTYGATTQSLTLPLVDMMACTTEKRGSQINGYGLKIPAGENIRDALISVIENFTPFHQHNIAEFEDTIPYDLEFNVGVYPYEVLRTILSLFPTYQMYYSPEGVFTVEEIPTTIDDDVFLDETVIDALILPTGETRDSSFSEVRNTTEIIGRSLSADYTADSCTTVGTTYNIHISDLFEVLEQGALYGFTPDTTSFAGQKLNIQNTGAITIYLQGETQAADTPIPIGAMTAGIPYIVKYSNERFYLQGELEIHAIVQERNTPPSPEEQEAFKIAKNCRDVQWVINPDSPFAADAIGEVWQVKSDGEYANIYTTQLAIERGFYENWKTTRLQDRIALEMHLIPWMDVNKKIRRTNPMTGTVETFIVQSISFDLKTFTMTVEAITFYPYYPFAEKIYVKNGDLISTFNAPPDALSFDIIDGELVCITGDGYEESPYANFEFFLGDDGDLYWVH